MFLAQYMAEMEEDCHVGVRCGDLIVSYNLRNTHATFVLRPLGIQGKTNDFERVVNCETRQISSNEQGTTGRSKGGVREAVCYATSCKK